MTKPEQKGTQIKPVDVLRRELDAMGPQFAMVLPPHVTTEKFVRVVVTAIQKTPSLIQADRASVFGAAMAAAQDGLLPDGREGAIVPFKGMAQWMPMAKGLLKLVRNSGELGSIAVEAIYSADKFRYWIDDNGAHVEHEPALFADARGEFIGVYAVAKTKDGDVYVEAMNKAQVEKVRAVSRNKDGNTWRDWYDEMAKKSVIRRLSKRLPMSTDLENVLERDNDNYDLEQPAQLPERRRRIDTIIGNSQPAKALEKGGGGSNASEPEVVSDAPASPAEEIPPEAEAAAAAVDKMQAEASRRALEEER